MGLFKVAPPVPRDELDWLVACFAWLRRVLDDEGRKIEAVLPGNAALAEATTASELFAIVQQQCEMADWPCHLERIEDEQSRSDPAEVQLDSRPLGTFSYEGEGEGYVIRYSASLLRKPDNLVATFAHELSHYLLEGRGVPPGGPDLVEHATDCCAAYLGFGVFLANSARHFEQWTDGAWQGWRSSASGYLSEQALVTATALAAQLNAHDADAIEAQLKPYLQRDFRRASKAIARDYPALRDTMADLDLRAWNFA